MRYAWQYSRHARSLKKWRSATMIEKWQPNKHLLLAAALNLSAFAPLVTR
jgi:hypothetical protein